MYVFKFHLSHNTLYVFENVILKKGINDLVKKIFSLQWIITMSLVDEKMINFEVFWQH